MRGLPPFQALLLLIILTALGFAGSHFIGLGIVTTPIAPATQTETSTEVIEAEVELVFSSPPLSYKLIQAPATEGDGDVLLQSTKITENPTYGSVEIIAHSVMTYWLEVRWPEEPAENSQHFVRINISPSHGESQAYAYFTGYKEIDETFEYTTGGSPHE